LTCYHLHLKLILFEIDVDPVISPSSWIALEEKDDNENPASNFPYCSVYLISSRYFIALFIVIYLYNLKLFFSASVMNI